MVGELLMIFVKKPELGKVKTRLAATIGDEKALFIYRQLLQRTFDITQPLDFNKSVHYTPEIAEQDLWNNGNYKKLEQSAGDLGQRMAFAFGEAFQKHYDKVCIIGSDCYELTTEIIEEAFSKLNQYDIVIGPSSDGGYYLLGMKTLHTSLFENIAWSTEEVLSATIRIIKEQGLSYFLLPTLSDVDREEDLGTIT